MKRLVALDSDDEWGLSLTMHIPQSHHEARQRLPTGKQKRQIPISTRRSPHQDDEQKARRIVLCWQPLPPYLLVWLGSSRVFSFLISVKRLDLGREMNVGNCQPLSISVGALCGRAKPREGNA